MSGNVSYAFVEKHGGSPEGFGVQNASFIIARMFRWFSSGEYPYSPNGEKAKDRVIKVGRKEINWQKLVFFAMLPAIIIVLGTIVLYVFYPNFRVL
ncbi:hypothetical protein [Parapedobacter tibetensis]|uniref:hypothetical protein n=1 Tax=Parapedobacter tibetensis TaxID=2972951 RepID=UPI00214DC7D1|nr:hypothetical protein [Parapedobacter tibetensis]